VTTPLPYRTHTPSNWERHIEGTFHEQGEVLIGPCPTCEDTMSIDLSDLKGPVQLQPEIHAITVYVRCSCDGEHPGRKDATPGGCGADGHIEVAVWPAGGPRGTVLRTATGTSPASGTTEHSSRGRQMVDRSRHASRSARASTVVVSRDDLKGLSTGYAVWVACTLGGGIDAAAIAIRAAATAEQGRFRSLGVTKPPSAKELFENETNFARRLLILSRGAVAASMILLVSAVLIAAFGNRAATKAAAPRSLIITDRGTHCGTIAQVSNGQLILRNDSGSLSAAIPVASVRVLSQVASCPK